MRVFSQVSSGKGSALVDGNLFGDEPFSCGPFTTVRFQAMNSLFGAYSTLLGSSSE